MTAEELERLAQAAADAEGDRINLEYPVEASVVRAVLRAVVPAVIEVCAVRAEVACYAELDPHHVASGVRKLAADLLPKDAG